MTYMFKAIHYCSQMYFRDKCAEIYELDPAHFMCALGIAWQACLKKTRLKLELLTNIDMLLLVEKAIRGRIFQANIGMLKRTKNI